MQTLVTVHLNVKGNPIEAYHETVKRMNEWFTDPIYNIPPDKPEGGYPPKTLLHYTVKDPKVVSMP